MANNTVQVTDKEYFDWKPKTASTAIAYGAILAFDGSGGLTPASSTSKLLVGISRKAVVSTDSDYASATLLPYTVLREGAEYEMDVYSGTALTAAMVGNSYDLYDSSLLNVGGTTHKVVTVTGYISATRARVKFNGNYVYLNAAA